MGEDTAESKSMYVPLHQKRNLNRKSLVSLEKAVSQYSPLKGRRASVRKVSARSLNKLLQTETGLTPDEVEEFETGCYYEKLVTNLTDG
jgi:hypothetical protein